MPTGLTGSGIEWSTPPVDLWATDGLSNFFEYSRAWLLPSSIGLEHGVQVTMILRITATSATFLSLPRARRRSYNRLGTELKRIALSAHM